MPYFPFNMFPYSNLHNLNLDWMLMTIQALTERIMQYEGSATPYDDAPLMDGTASPGAAFKYARGDHRHPSDTTKFDKTGGTIMGIVDIAPRRVWTYLGAPGWYRVLSYESNIANDVMGAAGMQIDLFINRSGASNEAHKITLDLIYNPAFVAELSKSNNNLITKIRYNKSTAGAKQYGYVDIYYAGNAQNTVLVDFALHTASPAVMEKVNAAALQNVAASPAGETVLTEYSFAANTDGDASLTAISSRGSITSGKAVRVGKMIHVNFVLSTTVSATNSPAVAFTNRALCETALSCIDITNGIASSITSTVPCGVGTNGSICMKEIIADHIYAITGQFIEE